MSVSSSRAVSMRIGIGFSAWMRRVTSRPSMPGSITSSTMASGCRREAASTPARPSRATSTRQPSADSRCAMAAAIAGSSSTTSTVAFCWPDVPEVPGVLGGVAVVMKPSCTGSLGER